MNNTFKNIDIEGVLFFDTEIVRRNKELDINSKEFELYQKKIRNRDTDELPTSEEVVDHYNKRAALKVGYSTIICATVGKVIEGVLYLRSFIGTEEDILKNLYAKFQSSKYICGANILYFDLPVCRINSLRYRNLPHLIPEQYNESGRKSWHMEKSVIELLDIFKGTHYSNSSLDEICYHLGIESPKTDLDGSQVSETYYEGGGIKIIEPYCKRDVFAVVNIFCHLQGKPLFESYVDANEAEGILPEEKESSVLERIYKSKELTLKDKEELQTILKKKKLAKKDKEIVKDIVTKLYINCEIFKSDTSQTAQQKEKQIEEILNEITP